MNISMDSTSCFRYSTKNQYRLIAKMSPLMIFVIDLLVVRDAIDLLRLICGNLIWERWLMIRRFNTLLSALRLPNQIHILRESPALIKMRFQSSNKPSLEESPAISSTIRPPREPSPAITAGSNPRHSWQLTFSITINTPVTVQWNGRRMC